MSTKIVKINRGDSFNFNFKVTDKYDNSKSYLLTSRDVVYFALLTPHQRFEDAVLIKGYTFEDQNEETGEIFVNIIPNDTRKLTPGVYYYTLKLQRGGTLGVIDDFDEPDEVRTLVERTKFIINE
ncbi:MAG: hypothetical protein IKL08_00115 [Clostridia bacterium]|nr:hypothetical protein [Clostridia bacterium]